MSFIKSNLFKRTIVTVILAPLVLVIIALKYTNPIFAGLFCFLVAVTFTLALKEWITITKTSPCKILWWLFGAIYILTPAVILIINTYSSDTQRIPSLIYVLLVVWLTDIGGYIFGKSLGGPKLAPSISPNKTWAGAIGGILLVVTLIFVPLYFILPYSALAHYPLSSIVLLSIVAQLGDLFESWVKRRFNVKDSGTILPGHGGILDRIDGLIPVLWLTLLPYIMGWKI